MKPVCSRLVSLLLAALMLVSMVPAGAARVDDDALPAVPLGDEAAAAPAARELPSDAADAAAALLSDGQLTIPGYTRVTEMPADGLEAGRYLLVVARTEDSGSNYYMLYPGTNGGGEGVNNAARLVVGSDGAATGYQIGSGTSYDDATVSTDFSDADNRIVPSGSGYTVSADSRKLKCGGGGSNAVYQNDGAVITITSVGTDCFRVKGASVLRFYEPHMNFNQNSTFAETDPEGHFMLFKRDPISIPGYTQVTDMSHLREGYQYLVVAQGKTGLYALYPRTSDASAGGLAGSGVYGRRCARLTVNGDSVTATAVADSAQTAASLTEAVSPLSKLHLTVSSVSNGYKFKSAADSGVQLNLADSMFNNAATALDVSVDALGVFTIKNETAPRYLSFSEYNTVYKFNSYGSDFWGPGTQEGAPVYIFIQGDLPQDPGMNLSKMLAADSDGYGAASTAQSSWVFTGGRAAQGSYADIQGARSWAGHFEEYVRYTQAKVLKASGESDAPYFQRHVINAAYDGQTLKNAADTFATRIAPLDPRAVVYLVDENGSGAADFDADLTTLITSALALRDNTGMIVIQTLTQTDKTAVDAVAATFTAQQQANILSLCSVLDAASKTGGYPNAQGHLDMAKALADAVAGSAVSGAAKWPYGVAALSSSNFTAGWPEKTAVTANHDGFAAPGSPSAPQTAVKNKVDAAAPMTWLFMGDSITHGSAWTGGYDSMAQLFEKFVKDDLGRKSDVVINAGSSGATTASTVNDLARRLTKYSPDVVVLMLGTNDVKDANIDETAYKANLRTILDAIVAKGAVPVLRTPPPTTNSGYSSIGTYAEYAKAVAQESAYADKVILVDQYDLWTHSNWRDAYQSRNDVHPDEGGHLWFVHQLINDLGLWDANAEICNLEYVAREVQEPVTAPVIPGYTQLTDMANLDPTKGYLIVSQTTDGKEIYALYPSKDGETLTAGSLPTPAGTSNGARAAKLTVDKDAGTVSAVWLKGNATTSVHMEALHFGIKADSDNQGKYIFTAANRRHLNMADYMFTEGTVSLSVTSRGADTLYAFQIRNPDASGGGRVLDFTRTGDENAFPLSGNLSHYGTDFWCPRSCKMPIFLYQSTAEFPTIKKLIQNLLADVAGLNEVNYTAATWAALQTQVTAANAVLSANPDADGDDQVFVDALAPLQDAFDLLVAHPVAPEVPQGAVKKEVADLIPAGGATTGNPFPTDGSIKGNDGYLCTNVRIPSIITLRHQTGENAEKNGRLLAAIDARWSHAGDACNLDSLVSHSDDGGKNWTYRFANYFGDSTDMGSKYATAFIDPQLTEGKDGTIYMLADLWPAGVALNTAPMRPATSSGYVEIDGVKRLVLHTSPNTGEQSDDNWGYWVGDFAGAGDRYAPVYEKGTTSFTGFYLDEYYYLYHTDHAFADRDPANDKIWCKRREGNTAGDANKPTADTDTDIWVQQNVFFYSALFHVRNASYLWLTTSTDGGETWSAPQMINDQVRTGVDKFYGVGPGAGLCIDTEGSTDHNAIPDGTIIMPVYIWDDEHAGFIYSIDKGENWRRSDNYATPQGDTDEYKSTSSESCLVQLDDTTVRHFFRESWRNSGVVKYTDHTWNPSKNGNKGGWDTGSVVSVTDTPRYGACQLSAIKYSEQINGKDLILYSAPKGGGRSHGVIHSFLVNADKTLTLLNTYPVNEGAYIYSTLTETENGDIALLYEHDSAAVTFQIIPLSDLISPTSINLMPSDATVTLYTNTDMPDDAPHTLQFTASVLPAHAPQDVTWSSSVPSVATVDQNGLVTALRNGETIIRAESSTKNTVFATCRVKVNTRIKSITVQKGGTGIGNDPIKVYTNAADPGHSVTLTAVTTPANITHPQLDWTRPNGAKGQITLSDRGENGRSITITAVPGEKNVGEVLMQVASADHPTVFTQFKVHVIRKLENDVTISIQGVNDPDKTPQFGQTLEADLNNLQMTDAGKDLLTYEWSRTKDGKTEVIKDENNEPVASKTYTLTQDDIGATISVTVTAGVDSFYEGSRSATRAQPVELADGPLTGPQDLEGHAPSAAGASDGSISGFGSDFAAYEWHLAGTVDTEWHAVTAQTVEGLAAGTYQIHAKATATHKEGGFSVVTVPAAGATTYPIALDAMTGGRVSRSDSVAAANAAVILTVLPETGRRLAENGLRVEKADGSTVTARRVSGREGEYTFTMPAEAVTVKATFEALRFTVTHELTDLRCALGAAAGHSVTYGENTAITLLPNEGYVLPLRKDIHVYNAAGDEITGWSISDDGTVTITGGVTSDLRIVAAARSATHPVNYQLQNGLKKSAATEETAGHMAAYTGVLEAEPGYTLPESVIVTVDGSLIGAENYLYNKETGEISISAGRIYGNVLIAASGVLAGSQVVRVESVTLDAQEITLNVGGSQTLTATVSPDNATDKTVIWSSSDPAVATVEDGAVTAVAEGEAVITVMTQDGRKTAVCAVTVDPAVTPTPSNPSSAPSVPSPVTTAVVKADGTKVTTVTDPDGTVTQTVEQPDGTKSQAVTTPEGEKTITVTDPQGEEVAKVEIPAQIPAPKNTFVDIDNISWAKEPIDNMAALGLVKGVGGDRYDPLTPMTRGALATVLHRLSQGSSDYEVVFRDVSKGQYYAEGVAWAAKVKVVTGYTPEIFAPDDIITREQLAVMLARYAKLIGMDTAADKSALNAFVDGDKTGTWAVDGVAWAVSSGILRGRGQNDLDPGARVSRAEVAVMLDRFIALIK